MSSESLSEAVEEEQSVALLRTSTRITNNMEARADHQTVKRYNIVYWSSFTVGQLLIVMVLVWSIKFRGGFGWSDPALEFNWHPLLMVVGLIFLYAQAILVYRSARNARKAQLKVWHASMHCLAFILAVIALKAVFDSHNYASPPIANLYTLHSWIGLTTVILFSCQFVAGFVSFMFPRLQSELRAAYMPLHVNFGVTIFVMAVLTAMMGLLEKAIFVLQKEYADLPSEALLINIIGVTLLVFGLLVLYLIKEANYKRVSLPEDEIYLTGGSNE